MRSLKMAWQAVICATGLLLTAPAMAMADSARFDIAAQPLPAALKAFAAQAHMQLLYQYGAVAHVTGNAVVGELETHEALEQLLRNTGLEVIYSSQGAATIRSINSSTRSSGDSGSRAAGQERSQQSPSQDGSQNKSFWDRFRVAQVDQGAPAGASTVEKKNQHASDQRPVKIEEVVVTAQKREERLIDVPISIAVVSADELKKRKVTSLEDLPFVVPGLAIQGNGASRTIEVRGISNSVGNSSLVGLYLDEVAVNLNGFFQINPSTYDLERVEVLRGPQGTLYGAGSAGGTIRFITKNPVLDRFAMNADVAALFTQGGAPGQRVNAVLNVPLVQNELGLRIAGTFDHEGGWINQPAADQKDINGQNLTNVRVKGLWQPVPQFTVNAMAEIYRGDRSTGTGEDANGNITQVFNLTTTPRVKDDHDIYNLTLTYDFSAVRVLNAISYIKVINDSRNTGYSFQYTPPGTPPFSFYTPISLLNDHALTEELRLTSIGAGPWQWTLGGFYRHYRDSYDQPLNYFDLAGPPGTPLPTPFPYSSDSLFKSSSAYADTSYRLTDRLTLGAGVRYFRDNQEFTTPIGALTTQTGDFHSVDPRAYAQYKLTNDINVYASAAKGFRSGGFNSLGLPPYVPESLWTYELGTKMSVLDGRLRADAAVFYSDYEDYLVFGLPPLPAPPILIVSNAGSARLKGIEWDLTWHPADHWTLRFNGDYLDTRFTKINATSTAYDVGDPLDLVPKYQYTVSGQRDFSWSGKPGFVRLDYGQQGRETYRNRSIGPWYYSESDVIRMLNFDAGLRWSDNLGLGLFAQNLLNDRGFTDPFSNEDHSARSRPRTYGIEFNVTFD